MELEKFLEIRSNLCLKYAEVSEGKMMSSPAIHYKKKVFAFFSRQDKMVYKLGKNYPMDALEVPLTEFNPFKKKGPLTGWYEADFEQSQHWNELAETALELLKKEL